MNFRGTTTFLTLATPALTHGFRVADEEGASRESRDVSSPAAQRATFFPIVRRRHPFFRDMDQMIEEMDAMMDPRATLFPIVRRRPPFIRDMDQMIEEMDAMMDGSLAALQRPFAARRPLGGFDVYQDENEYRVSIDAPDIDVNDLSLSLDNDGRVLRLKGQANKKEGGMAISSRFEKAVLLAPGVDTGKITASISDGTLTVVAPKTHPTAAIEQAQVKEIKIRADEQPIQAQLSLDEGQEGVIDNDDTTAAKLATKDSKMEKAEGKGGEDAEEKEKKWPARDFP